MKDIEKALKELEVFISQLVEYNKIDGVEYHYMLSRIDFLERKILNGEIRESGVSICGLGVNPYCSERAKDGTCLHGGICKHKQIDMERT